MPDLPHTQLQNFSLAEVYTRRKENNDYRIRLAAFGKTNREVASRLEKLRKVQAQGDTQEVKRAEMAYLQAL